MSLFNEKKRGFLSGLFSGRSRVDEDFLDELEEKLILADAGVETAELAAETLRSERGLKGEAIRSRLVDILVEQMEKAGSAKLDLSTKPAVIVMVGVNGVGKTTTIGKLAGRFRSEGKKVLLAAADTFRAAAIDQLKEWGTRAGVEVIAGQEGSDPASVVFDACQAAKARRTDILIVDTAGRLHNKKNLMEELKKISRVADREFGDAYRETLVVLDGTTGQNAMAQARDFTEAVPIDGIVLTKLDGTAKGGVVVAIQSELGLPVKYIGVGEGIDDLQKFDPDAFAKAMVLRPEEEDKEEEDE